MHRYSGTRAARTVVAGSIALVIMLFGVGVASAHEHREVGEYEFTVGFTGEPALVGEPNGLDLRVATHTGDEAVPGEPIEGLEETLEAEVTYGGETKTLELRPVFNQPGAYTADIIPTAEGAYTFHIYGTVNDLEVDETFTSGPDTFSEVGSTDAISFPATTDDGSSAVADAEDAADSARTLAIVGLVVGALGLAAGAAGLAMAMNARSTRAGTTVNTVE